MTDRRPRRGSLPPQLPSSSIHHLSPKSISPSRLSPKMACLPEHGELLSPPSSIVSSSTSSPVECVHERRRVFSFPKSNSQSPSISSQNRKLPYGNDSMWQWSSKSTKLQQSSFAEKLFLASKQSKQFQKLRSFSVNKRGTLIDCGYCYRPLLQQKKDTKLQSTNIDRSRTRRATCPEIWLSHTEETLNTSLHYCQLCICGSTNVGKKSIARLLVTHHESVTDDNVSDDDDTDSDNDMNEYKTIDDQPITSTMNISSRQISYLVNGNEVRIDIQSRYSPILNHTNSPPPSYFDRSNSIDIRLLLHIVVYAIDSHESFIHASQSLYRIHQQHLISRHGNDRLLALLVANKADLQRTRRVTNAGKLLNKYSTIQISFIEGRLLAKVYNCPFVEISALLSINIETVVKELLRLVQHRIDIMEHDDQQMLSIINNDRSELTSFVDRVRDRTRRLARSCEQLFSRIVSF